MPDLALIHPLLLANPFPSDALHAAVRQAATAGARLDTRFAALDGQPRLSAAAPSLSGHEREVLADALAWRQELQPALYASIDDVAAFAERMRAQLGPMAACARRAGGDSGALQALSEGAYVLKLAALAHAAGARQATLGLAGFHARMSRSTSGFVAALDALVKKRGASAAMHMQVARGARARREALGKAIPAVAAVMAAQAALELAWHELAENFDTVLDRLRSPAPAVAQLAPGLELACADWSQLSAGLRAPGSTPRRGAIAPAASEAPPRAAALKTVSAFRSEGIGDGAETVAATVGVLDSLAGGITQLPSPAAGAAAPVGRHIDTVRAAALAWPGRLRPQLLGTMYALRRFGEHLVERDAPELLAALERIGSGGAPARQQAACLVASLGARLAELGGRFDGVTRGLGDHLDAMARTSASLERDTAAVARRLQSGQARTEALACQVSRLQSQLDGAGTENRHWLPQGLAALVGARPGNRLAGVTRQMQDVRAEQAAALGDAASLQTLLPALSAYLTAASSVAAGAAAMHAGVIALRAQLAELRGRALEDPAAAHVAVQLQAALADWRAVVRCIGRLAPAA